MPDDDSAMTDAAGDAVDAASGRSPGMHSFGRTISDNGKPGSRAHARGGVEVARARTAALAALFRDSGKEAPGSRAPAPPRSGGDAAGAASNEDAEPERARPAHRRRAAKAEAEASRCEAGRDAASAPRASVPANQLQREQAQLEAEFESLSGGAPVEARTRTSPRAQFATHVQQHD